MDQWAHLNLVSTICIWKVRTLPNSQFSQFSLFIFSLSTNIILHLSVSASTGEIHISNEKCHGDAPRFSLSRCSFQISISSSTLKIGMKELSLMWGPAGSYGREAAEETSSVCHSPLSNKQVTAAECVTAMDFSGNNQAAHEIKLQIH